MNTATITAHGFTGFLGRGAAPRELECLLAIAGGFTGKEAARELGVTENTIKKRLLCLSTKLNVNRRAALVAEAFKRGLIAPLCVVFVAVLLLGQHQQPLNVRRPTAPRRVEMRLTSRHEASAWAA